MPSPILSIENLEDCETSSIIASFSSVKETSKRIEVHTNYSSHHVWFTVHFGKGKADWDTIEKAIKHYNEL